MFDPGERAFNGSVNEEGSFSLLSECYSAKYRFQDRMETVVPLKVRPHH